MTGSSIFDISFGSGISDGAYILASSPLVL